VAAVPIAELLEALRRDTNNPNRWSDVGEAMLRAGNTEKAAYCFSTSVILGPDDPAVLLRAAEFDYGLQENTRALKRTSRVLEKTATYGDVILASYTSRKIAVRDVLDYGISTPRAAQVYLHYLMVLGKVADTMTAWNLGGGPRVCG
jgi:hypothetical protein